MNTAVDVIGTGGAGGLLAAALQGGGLPPRVISRGAALRQLRNVGLTIITDNTSRIYTPINCSAIDDVRTFAPLVLLATKSYDIPAAIEEITPRIHADSLFICVQNGFATHDRVSTIFGAERAVMSVLYVGANILSPGVINVEPGVAQLFLPEALREVLQPLVDALNRGGVEATLLDDIEQRMWMKELFFLPFALINAETHLPAGKILEDQQARTRWSAIAREVAAIANACGTPMPEDPAAASLAVAERFDQELNSSFARDVWARRPTEAEALFEPLVKRAHAHHVACPLLQAAYAQYAG